MTAKRLSVLATGLLLSLPATLSAQVALGGHVLYAPEPAGLEGVDGAFGVGARLGFGLPLTGLGVHGTFDFFFPDCGAEECALWDGGVNLTVDLEILDPVTPYGGAGVAFRKLDVEGATLDDTGFNVLAGIRAGGLLPVTLLGEARYQIMNDFDDQLVLAVGFFF